MCLYLNFADIFEDAYNRSIMKTSKIQKKLFKYFKFNLIGLKIGQLKLKIIVNNIITQEFNCIINNTEVLKINKIITNHFCVVVRIIKLHEYQILVKL